MLLYRKKDKQQVRKEYNRLRKASQQDLAEARELFEQSVQQARCVAPSEKLRALRKAQLRMIGERVRSLNQLTNLQLDHSEHPKFSLPARLHLRGLV